MKRKFFVSIIIPLSVFLVYTSCTKLDTTDLGNGLIPPIDNIHTFDTILDVFTDNKLFVDTTTMPYDEDHAVGIIEDDPEFGKTIAALYASFTPGAYGTHPFRSVADVKIDSVVLSLKFTKLYGDSTAIQEFEVREIDPLAVFQDTLYKLDASDFAVLPDPLGKATRQFLTLNDSTYYVNAKDTISVSSELRIKLDTAFGRRFVEADTSGAYKNDENFRALFKGVQVVASEGGSSSKTALAYFDLNDNTSSRITLYCRVTSDGKTDTVAPFFANTTDPQANLIRRTPAHGYADMPNDPQENKEKLYIQSTPGSYATIKIPGLSGLDNRVIHRAELIAERYPSAGDYPYTAPDALFLDAVNETGDSTFTIRNDFVQLSQYPGYELATLGGVLKKDQYVFNISRYVQSIVTQKFPNPTLRIHAPFLIRPYFIPANTNTPAGRTVVSLNTPIAFGRVVLYGGGSTAPNKMRLRIIYSKI